MPTTMQLRFLRTVSEIGTEKNSTVVFPVPIDLPSTFVGPARRASDEHALPTSTIPVVANGVAAAPEWPLVGDPPGGQG